MERETSSRGNVLSRKGVRDNPMPKLNNTVWFRFVPAFFLLIMSALPVQAQTATATITAGTAPYTVAVNPITNKIYVANQTGDNVTVIDGATNATTTVVAGNGPSAVAVNTVTNMIYVANTFSDNITVIDGATNGTTTIAGGDGPSAVAVNPVTNKIYVANVASNNVTVIDGGTNGTTAVAAGTSPLALAVNPVTNKIYVANTFGSSVTVINGADNSTVTVAAGTQVNAIAVNPVTNKIYTANTGTSTITVIDGATNGTTTVTPSPAFAPTAIAVNPVTDQYYAIGTGPGPTFFTFSMVFNGTDNSVAGTQSVGASPGAVAVNPVTGRVYVANTASGTVTTHFGPFVGATTVTVGTGPRAVAVNPVTNKIYVANNSSNNVTVIDGATNSKITVSAGTVPQAVAVNPVTNKIYVPNNGSDNVTVIDGATNSTATVAAGNEPQAVAVNPATNKIYVPNFGSNDVTVIDGATNTTATVAAGTQPLGVAVNPVTNKIYVSNDDDTVTVIDGATNSTTTVAAGTCPRYMAVNLVTNKIYVGNGCSNDVTVIDGATNATTTVTDPNAAGTSRVAVNSITNKIYVTNFGSNNVTVIDGATNGTTTVSVESSPDAVAVNPVTNKIYVGNNGSATVTVIDGATNSTTTVAAGTGSYSLAVNPVTGKIYVANFNSANLTVIDEATNTTTTLAAGSNPEGMAVNPVTNKIYVANFGGNNVTVITEQNVQAIPLEAAITPLAGDTTSDPAPTFNFTVSSAFSPTAPNPNGLFFQVDTWQGEWQAGTVDSDFTGILPTLQEGFHILYAFTTDGQDATSTNTGTQSSPLISAITAYGFRVGPTPPPPAPAVQLSTASLTFGNQVINTTSPVMQVTLTNNGTATLNITTFNVQISTGNTTASPHFSSNNNCGSALLALASCTINAFFNPTALGPLSAVIKIVSDAPGTPHFISLSGTGLSEGVLGGLPANFDFGDQAVGSTSVAHTFTLNNTGPGTLGISNIAVTGDFALVSVGGDCGATVAATTSCNIGVEFSPLSSGASGGTLTITHDGAGSPAVVILTGNGVVVDPVALINQPLVPTSVAPGSGAFTLTVNGTGFTPNSIVHWNGNAHATTFVNSGQVTAAILANDVVNATTAEVAVDNPAPGGDGSIRSNIVFFHVTDPATSVAMSQTSYAVGSGPFHVVTQDFNGDGVLDLAVPNSGGAVSILLGVGDGTFTPHTQSPFATGSSPFSATTGDFDGDGDFDLAVANFNSYDVSILLWNTGSGTFDQPQPAFDTGVQPRSMTAGDFNADGKLDLAVTISGSISILLGNGDGTFPTHTPFAAGVQPYSVTTGDFDGDGKLDLAAADISSSAVSILLGIGDGTFPTQTPYATGVQPISVTAGDFNGDDILDLAVANTVGNTVSILLGVGSGTFAAQTTFATGTNPISVTTGDFNGDGQLDLAVAHSNLNYVSILLGNGNGTFQPQTLIFTGVSANSVTAGDFNEDGRLDVAVAHNSGTTISVLLQTIDVQLSPASLDFGNQLINTTSPVMQVILTNTGTATLNFACPGCGFNVQISTSNTTASPHFSANNTCGTSLGTGLSCTINAFFTPLVLGPLSAVIAINSDDPGSPHFVNLSGTGTTNAAITVGPAVNFPGNPLLVNCPTKPVTITNSGDVPLDIASIAATLPFSVASHNCPTTLAVDASCVAQVRFSPTVVGAAAGTLTVTTNPATTGNTVNLTGTGTPACQLLAAVRVVTVLRGTEAQEFGIEDAKPSCSPVELSLTCSVENPAACLLTPAVIAPSGASTLRVTNLKRVGAESLVVEVTSTSEFRQATERVSVRFADFAMTRSPEEAAVEAGGATSYALAVRPVNGLAGPVTFTCSGAPRGATCAVEPANITLDGASVAQVKVKVATSGGAALPMVNLLDDGARRAVPLLAVLLGLLMVGATRRVARGGRGSAPSGTGRGHASPLRWVLATAMLLMLLWASCGGGGVMNLAAGGTPAGRYALKVTGTYSSSSGPTPGTLSNSTTLNLKVN